MYNVGGALVSREPMRTLFTQAYSGTGTPSTLSGVPDIHTHAQTEDGLGNNAEFRCAFVGRDGYLYTVLGDTVFRAITSDEPSVRRSYLHYLVTSPSILSSGNIEYAVGHTGVAMVTLAGKYFLNYATQSVTELTDSDLPACVDVAYIGGRYVWLTADGESIFWSEVDDAGNVSPLYFFDAEARPDKNRALSVIGEDLFIFGQKSIQRFRNIGGASQPFINVPNSVIPIGYLSGFIEMSTKVAFVGREEGGALGVYEMSGSSLNKISSSVVDNILTEFIEKNEASTLEYASAGNSPVFIDIDLIRGISYGSYGSSMYVFTTDSFSIYARHTPGGYQWGFLSSDIKGGFSDGAEWHKRPLGKDYDPIGDVSYKPVFECHYAVFYDRRWVLFCNDKEDGFAVAVYEKGKPMSANAFVDGGVAFSEGSTTYFDAPITRGLYLGLSDAAQRDTVFDSLEVSYSRRARGDYMTAVTGDSGDTLNMYLSLTGLSSTWSTAQTISYGDKDESERIRYNFSGGLTPTNGCLQLALETSAEIPFTITGLNANV